MKLNFAFNATLIAASIIVFSCGGSGSSNESTSQESATTSTPQQEVKLEDKYKDDPVFQAGQAKAKEAGCTACHMVERKIVGPSYKDVAEKYENNAENLEMLSSHVIKGNVGNWGEIPMPAHPHLERADVETIVKYVLMLRR